MEIKTLFVDDNPEICRQMGELINNYEIGEYKLIVTTLNTFQDAVSLLNYVDFDLIILDVYEGTPGADNPNELGKRVLEIVKQKCFAPVIFFTGRTASVADLKSDFVKVVNKGDGTPRLIAEINDLLSNNLILLKIKLNEYTKECLREYLWGFVYPKWNEFNKIKDNVSLNYLIIRRLAYSLSKDQIFKLLELEDHTHKLHPMEFYVCPPISEEYETGDILKLNDSYFVVLTPSCDLELREDGHRKATRVMLSKCELLTDNIKYIKYMEAKSNLSNCVLSPDSPGYKTIQTQFNNCKTNLEYIIKPHGADRYFFLPKTFFIENLIIDFEKIITVEYTELINYIKIAKIDDPIAQSMISSFIRWYNRVGFDDIDMVSVINNLDD